jgi:D-xylose transport system permease protein
MTEPSVTDETVTESDAAGSGAGPVPESTDMAQPSPGAMARAQLARLRSGDLGSLPILVGLLVIVLIFQLKNNTFLGSSNLDSLASQIASTGIIALGVVLVLLLGEIDLSVASVSGVGAAILAVANVQHGVSPGLSIILAVVAGMVIGLLHGLVFTRFGVPSFVVTLAGLLVWQGVQQRVLSSTGTINLPRKGWLLQAGQFKFFGATGSTVIVTALVVLYLVSQVLGYQRRRALGLPAPSLVLTAVKAAMLALVGVIVVWALLRDDGLGVPWLFVFFLALVIILEFVLRRTRYGRAIFAVGGNIEAARRAGLHVDAIRTSVFVLASTLAATGGVVEAMRAGSAGRDTGTGDVLINAIAAAVIGGTSLFGGRTRRYAALLGILVIGAIPNGLNLINLSNELRYIITGTVLLAAVIVDSITRRGRQAAGTE